MALELLLRNTNFYPYRDCSAAIVGGPYGGFCSGASQYRESIFLLESFVYDASADRYYIHAFHNQVDYPSWSIWRSVIHPETGAVESQTLLAGFATKQAYTSTLWNGGLNKIYALWLATPRVVEITLADGWPTDTQLANPILSATQIPDLNSAQFGILVCPERKLVTRLSSQQGLVVHDYSNYPAASVELCRHPFPELYAWSAGYEDDQRMWGLFSGTVFGAANSVNQSLLKYNFAFNRIELLTELQPSVIPDRLSLICFDTKRKKLAAVRIKADEANGAPNNAFELYSPRPAMTRITVPVNITRLAPDVRTQFRAHLLGTKAEGGASRIVELDNTSGLGTLPRKQVYTEESGATQFEYRSSTDIMTDTVTAEFDETKVVL